METKLLKNQKITGGLKLALMGLMLLYIGYKGVYPGWSEIKTDFPNYYIAAKSVVEGADLKKLYDDQWFQAKITENDIDAWGKFSPQPPLSALLMTPIAGFRPMAAKRICLCLNLIFILLIIGLTKKVFQLSWINSILAMLLMGKALSNDLYYGQVYVMITLMILVSFWLVKKYNLQVIAGTLLALAAWLKYFPVIFIFYAFIRGQYKLVISSVVTVLALLLVQFLVFGWEINEFYFMDILPAHLSGDIPGQGGFAIVYQSWPSFLNNLFVYDEVYNAQPIFNWAEGKSLMLGLIYLSVMVFLVFFIAKQLKNKDDSAWKNGHVLLLLVIGGLFLLPASASYHYMFLLVPACILLSQDTSLHQLSMISLIFAINFFPYPFADNTNILVLILSYPRLIALSVLLTLAYRFRHRIQRPMAIL